MRKSELAQLLLNASNCNIKLYDWQKRWLDDDSRFRVMLKSRAVGGSFIIALESFLHSLIFDNHLTLLISFSMRQSLELFRKVKDYIKSFEGVAIRHEDMNYRFSALVSETKTSVEFPNGSRIVSLPNNPDGVRGYRANHVYIDEAAMFKNDFEIKTAILPTLVAREGRLSLISTPKGRRGWFYEAWTSESFSKHQVHYSEAPHITQQDLEGMRASLTPLEWEQEMEMKFLDEANALFPYSVILDVVDDYELELRQYAEPVYLGIDFGRYRDSTVICGVEKGVEKLKVIFLDEMVGVDFNTQLSTIARIIEILRPAMIMIDKTGMGIPLFDVMSKKWPNTIGYTFTARNKEALIRLLTSTIHNKKIILPNHEKMINQLRQFQGGQQPEHDDYVIALALAVSGALRGPDVGRVSSVWDWS